MQLEMQAMSKNTYLKKELYLLMQYIMWNKHIRKGIKTLNNAESPKIDAIA